VVGAADVVAQGAVAEFRGGISSVARCVAAGQTSDMAHAVAVLVLAFSAGAAAEVLGPTPFGAIPPPGRGEVPLNPLILVPDPFTEVRVVDDGAAIVATSDTTATGQDFSALRRVLVGEPLRPQTHYRVISVVGEGDAATEQQQLTDFTTGDASDDDAPADPDVSFANGVLHAESDEAIAVLDVRQNQGPSTLAQPTSDGTVILSGSGQVTLSVVALDFAGNPSEPVEVDGAFQLIPGCCAQASPSTTATTTAGLLALLLLRRRS
jgi:hypothetical protein